MRLMPLLFAAALAASAAKANESAYSERNLDACKTLSQEDEGPSVTLECTGYKDLAVYFKEGDLRQSQAYGPISKAWLDEAFESFGPFNHTNAKIEWRIAAGKPVATIVRWFVSDPETTSDTDTRYGQVLVVSTIATAENPTSCVVGYVDALENKDANTLARKVADEEAHDFACGLNEPQWHGLRGKLAGEPVRHLPAAVE
ncbi:hypothetical protein KYK30_10025 [Shinella yambaruensis]|uniref:Uncharacterized protein n=1 Tax=Shinella yambaruensis TaxID=415996 RepID=A0ABQ5ZDL6_9HYPH|nr:MULTISPECIES: hypothetical protein [Shinella]MCJ8027961.1 hypothetical protein [Shinella yambaruensis]MCU7980031.1 hypothetical protein [Shinella yambaruensis]MCW5709944.1 hypothetical protein [Shinella sp.]GLR48993.1 hypothetical protein GCM10007923_01970 [Shinella yambaruensis]